MIRWSRRLVMQRLCVLTALPWIVRSPAAIAQTQPKPLRIGILYAGFKDPRRHLEASLVDELRKKGYVEGNNLILERRDATGSDELLQQYADHLAQEKLDAVVSTCTPSTRAMRDATQSTPIVMANVADPVRQGLIQSFAHPGGNVTGTSGQYQDIMGKMLELFQQVAPKARSVAVVVNTRNPVHEVLWQALQPAARSLGFDLLRIDVSGARALPGALGTLNRHRAAGLLVLPDDPMTLGYRKLIVEQATKDRLPSLFGAREFVEAGGLLSYGENLGQSYRLVATYVDKIAKGAKAKDLPVAQPTAFELVVNLNTAKALGLTIPESILLRADRVVE